MTLPSVVGAARLGGIARTELERAQSLTSAGDAEGATVALERADRAARRAAERFDGFGLSIAARVPVAGRSVRTARGLAHSVVAGAAAAQSALALSPKESPWSGGKVDIAALGAMRDGATAAAGGFERALGIAKRTPGWPLPGPLARARADLIARLGTTLRTAEVGRELLTILPPVLGAEGKRRYFLAAQNPAENRATGGFWGNYGVIEADGGRLVLTRFGRTTSELGPRSGFVFQHAPDWYEARYGRFGAPMDWRSLNMTPDFPTVASLAEANVQSTPGIGPVDGVIAADPDGLSALLRLTGPVTVAEWPEPITSDNVVRTTLRDAYIKLHDDRRVEFLGDVARTVWSALLTANIPARPDALRPLGDAVRRRRLLFHLVRPAEQRGLEALGADGSIGDPRRTVGVVTQNAAANKIDVYLRRELRYRVRLRDDGSADVEARVVLRNSAPAGGPPAYVIGPYDERFRPGVSRQFTSLYVPGGARLVDVRAPDGLVGEAEYELGFFVVSRFVDVAPGESTEMTYRFHMRDHWDPSSGRYELVLRRHPALTRDDISVEVVPPSRWRVERGQGMRVERGRGVAAYELDGDRRLGLIVSRTVLGRLVDIVT